MSVTDLPPALARAIHGLEVADQPPAPDPAAVIESVEAPAAATDDKSGPELDEAVDEHDPDLGSADPDAYEDDFGLEPTDGVPDIADDEPEAHTTVEFDDEDLAPTLAPAPAAAAPAPTTAPSQKAIPVPAASTAAAPTSVFAAFTPPIPLPSAPEPAAATNTSAPDKDAGPSLGDRLRQLAPGGLPRPALKPRKRRTVIALILVALVALAAALGNGPSKPVASGSTSPASRAPVAAPKAAAPAKTKAKTVVVAPKAKHISTKHAADHKAKAVIRTRVVVRRVVITTPAPAPAAAAPRVITAAPVRSTAPADGASEFRP
jgi:hypothetical protein